MAGSLYTVSMFRFTVQMCRNVSFCYYFPPLLCYELTFLFYYPFVILFVCFISDAMFFLSTFDLQLQIKFIYFLFLIRSPTVEVLQTGDLTGNKSQKPAISGFISGYIRF